jgi:hypothetical protein
MYKLKIGDLVCFNGAGQKYKTLGVVVDFDYKTKKHRTGHPGSILIMWSMVQPVMPRMCWTMQHNRDTIRSGDMIWHELGDWFEVVE